MNNQKIRLNPKTNFDLVYRGLMGVVDCRLLFLGDHARQLVRTYQEIVYRFSNAGNLNELYESLTSSSEMQQLYEIGRSEDKVSVVMRDSVFREPGPKHLVKIDIRFSLKKTSLIHPLPLNRFSSLGNLLPLLLRGVTENELRETLARRLGKEDLEWAIEFYRLLEKNGLLQTVRKEKNYFHDSKKTPRLTFLGHSSLLLKSENSSVIVDPFLRVNYGLTRKVLDVAKLKLDAICCSHSHWDHCDLLTLMWFDKDIPIVIPKVERPTAFNPPIVPALRALGFTDIREINLWEALRFGDIEVVPVPFHGEQDEPDVEMDHYTYILRTKGFTMYGGVDSFRDTYGEMKPVLERVREEYEPVLAFLPISKMVYAYKDGGANAYCRYLDNTLLQKSFQYTASVEDAAEWMTILKAQSVVPYATFTFSNWNTPVQVSDFRRALKRVGLSRTLYPLRPLDSLGPSDWNRELPSPLRRSALVLWFRAGAAASKSDRRMQRLAAYRLLHRAAKRILFGPA